MSDTQFQPSASHCHECLTLARALQQAWRSDNDTLRTRIRALAAAADRDSREFAVGWVHSIARMPEDEMRALLNSHYPTVARVMRKREAHEQATGHTLKGWQSFLAYAPEKI